MRPLALALAALTTLAAQTPAFEVVSVKPRAPEARPQGGGIRLLPGGRLQAPSVTVRQMIAAAHQLLDLQIVNAPAWTSDARFDVEATAPSGTTASQARAMLATLLAQRFRLRTHTEMRDMPVYVMRLEQDGRLGPGLHPSGQECRELTIPKNVPLPPPPPSPTEIERQTIWLGSDVGRCPVLFITMANQSHLTMREQTMDMFARRLTLQLDRLVLERTGLAGLYDMDLTYTSEAQAFAGAGEAPAVLTAVREQLGLRLESAREPVPLLVIDAIERPTAN